MNLKPCPFCGNSFSEFDEFDVQDSEGTPCRYRCDDCGAVGPWCYGESEGEDDDVDDSGAVKLWDRRPIEDSLRSERDELRRMLDAVLALDEPVEKALRAEVEMMRAVLKFYADENNWLPCLGPDGEPTWTPMWRDNGESARAALAQKDKT